MAINKPHGLAVQGGTGTRYHLDALLEAFVKKEGDVKPRLVHRLDKDTSGVMLLARNAKVARVLGMSFKSRDIKKIYWALVSPNPEEPEGEIRAPLAKQPFGSSKEKMVVDEEEGKPASTWYKVIERAGDMAAFVAFWPRTGRTHQIRAHAELVGFPLIGDTKYCDIDEYEHIKQKGAFEGLKIADRLHLHAHRLTLPHPTRKGQTLELIAPLPDDLKKSWQELGFDHKWNDQDVFE
jgi:23S rRNA pseudouridine955/2504/2580 synthase